MIIPFAEYRPDQPDLFSGGATDAQNVIPITERSYGPVARLSAYSNAITARAQGALSVADNDGNINVFAGDATKLYRLVAGTLSFDDISKLGGYTTAADQIWSIVPYGTRILFANFADAIQSYVIGSSTDAADLAATAPKCRYLAVIKGFVVAANTNDGTFGNRPQGVWWSATNDPTTWPTIGTSAAAVVESDRQDLFGDHGWIQGIVGGLANADGIVLCERAIFRMTYVGPPAIFRFDPIQGARGTPAPSSIVQVGGVVYYLTDKGFFVTDGTSAQPIGAQKVDNTFWGELDTAYVYRISGAFDPLKEVVAWAYPIAGNTGGNPNKILYFLPALNRWSYSEQECELLLRTNAFGYTLDTLDSISTSLDALPASLDSRQWTGGRLLFGAFDTTHKLATFTGTNLAARLTTQEYARDDGRRLFVRGVRPLVDALASVISVSVGSRDYLVDPPNFDSAEIMGLDGLSPHRVTGRYVRARVDIEENSDWTHAIGVEPIMQPEGLRSTPA